MHLLDKNRLLIIFFLILLVNWSATAQKKIYRSLEPAWTDPITLTKESKVEASEIYYGYHYLLKNMQYEVGKSEAFFHMAYKIHNENGVQNASELRFDFDPNFEKLFVHKIVIWRNGTPIDKLVIDDFKVIQREKQLEKNIYDESLSAILFMTDIRVGDIIEYSYSIKGTNPVFKGKFFRSFNLQSFEPIDELFIRVISPSDRTLHYKTVNSSEKPLVKTVGNKTYYTWHKRNIPAISVDDDTPSWFNPYPTAYLSEFSSWEEIVDWATPLFEVENISPELSAKIDSLKAQYTKPEERIEAAVKFVQNDIRYMGIETGISGYKPFPPSQVFKQRYGDCKDKSLLLATILNNLGIEANPALVNTIYADKIKDWLPSPYAFNHCIVQVKFKGEEFWYDPTISYQEGSYNTFFIPNYKTALPIGDKSPGIAKIKRHTQGKIKTVESFFFNDVGGPVKLNIQTDYYGNKADFQRSYFASTSKKEVEKNYLNYSATLYPGIKLAREMDFIDHVDENKFTTLEEYTIDQLWDTEGDSNILYAEFYPQTFRDILNIPSTPIRTMPLSLSFPLDFEHETQFFLPETWTVSPEEKTIKDKAFDFHTVTTYDPKIKLITIKYSYKTNDDHVAASDMVSYNKKHEKILDELGFSLTYNKNYTTPSSETNWAMVLFALVVLLLATFGALKLYRYDPQNDLFYTEQLEIGGWLYLIAFGLCITPLIFLLSILNNNYFDLSVWNSLTDESLVSYSPTLANIIALELFLTLIQLVFCVLLITLFFQRRSSFPILVSSYYFYNLLSIVLISSLLEFNDLVADADKTDQYKNIGQALFTSLIWIPYFNISKRVKRTFRKRLEPDEKEMPEELIEEMA